MGTPNIQRIKKSQKALVTPSVDNSDQHLQDELSDVLKTKVKPVAPDDTASSSPHEENKQPRSIPPGNGEKPKGQDDIIVDGDNRISSFNLSKWLIKNETYGKANDVLYMLDKENGIYIPLTLDRFDAAIRRAAYEGKIPAEAIKSINEYYLKELHKWVSAEPSIQELPERPNRRYIALANGILDLEHHRLIKDAQEFKEYPILFNRLPVKYIEHDQSEWRSSASLRYLQRFAHPDCRDEFVQHLKYTFGKTASNDRSGKTLTYLYGPTDSGKGICEAMLVGMLGYRNCSALSLAALCRQFGMINLYHKLLNVSADEDLSSWSMEIGTNVKLVTSGDLVSANKKFHDAVDFRPYSSLICFGNAAPVISRRVDAGGAISRRLNLIPTGPSVPLKEQDPYIFERELKPELNLLFSVCSDFYMENDMPPKIIPLETIAQLEINSEALFELWVEKCVFKAEETVVLKMSVNIWPCYKHFVENAPYASRLTQRQFEMMMATKFHNHKCPSKVGGGSAYRALRLEYKVYSPQDLIDSDSDDDVGSASDDRFGEW